MKVAKSVKGIFGTDIVKYDIMAAEYAGTIIDAAAWIPIKAILLDNFFCKFDPTGK